MKNYYGAKAIIEACEYVTPENDLNTVLNACNPVACELHTFGDIAMIKTRNYGKMYLINVDACIPLVKAAYENILDIWN